MEYIVTIIIFALLACVYRMASAMLARETRTERWMRTSGKAMVHRIKETK